MNLPAAKALRLLACVLSLTLASGCVDACLALAKQVCNCQPDDTTKANCYQRAKEAETTFAVRAEDEKDCQARLDSNLCTCDALKTAEGRVSCGIALAPDGGSPP
jgi:hypothetical protein